MMQRYIYYSYKLLNLVCKSKKNKILLDNLEKNFYVIDLTETWINEDNANIFSLDGYNFFHRNLNNKKVEELHCTLILEFNIK